MKIHHTILGKTHLNTQTKIMFHDSYYNYIITPKCDLVYLQKTKHINLFTRELNN